MSPAMLRIESSGEETSTTLPDAILHLLGRSQDITNVIYAPFYSGDLRSFPGETIAFKTLAIVPSEWTRTDSSSQFLEENSSLDHYQRLLGYWSREKHQQHGRIIALQARPHSTWSEAGSGSHNASPIQHMPIVNYGTALQMLTRIRELGTYPEGWDGAEGKTPSHTAVTDATRFARILVHHDIYPPYISLASDGEINFLWMLPHVHVDLGFYGDGTYSYYGMTAGGEEFLADEVAVSTPLHAQLLQCIRKS